MHDSRSLSDEPQQPWRLGTERFRTRAEALGEIGFSVLRRHLAQMPSAPFDFSPSQATGLKYQLCILVVGAVRSARDLAASTSALWLEGHFLLASIGVRTLVELWGQLAWAETQGLAPLTAGKLDVAAGRIAKLLLGANTDIALIRDLRGPHALVNVMEFVRAAEAESPGFEAHYAFLCDSAHPSQMQHTWMLFAGPDHDNWLNQTFAREADKMLDRVLLIAEASLAKVEEVGERLAGACLPDIVREFSERSAG